MANSSEYYQIPYDYSNIHHYNHHHYHQQQPRYNPVNYHQQQLQFGYNPVNYHQQQPQFGYNPIDYHQQQFQFGYNPVNYHQEQPQFDYNQVNYHQEQPQFGYNQVSFDWNRSEFDTISSSIAYSVSNSSLSETKSYFYDPNLYTIYESPPQFSIYSSVHQSNEPVFNEPEFNEPEFDEYDPTPYGGGYDIVSTYGKPLPPSEVLCYSPVNSSPAKPLPPPVFVAPDRAYGGGSNKIEVKNQNFVSDFTKLPKPMEAIEEEDEEDDEESSYGSEKSEIVDKGSAKSMVAIEDDEESSYGSERSEIEDKGAAKSMEAIKDKEEDDQESRKVEEIEVKALYVPSGYGLEATDLCEAIFGGYFPCVLRNKRREQDREASKNVSCWESNDLDPWEQTSDYIFGDLYPYGYENQTERNRFEMSGYGYQRY